MIEKESTKAAMIVMVMILIMFIVAEILVKGCEHIDAKWEERYPTQIQEVQATGLQEISA